MVINQRAYDQMSQSGTQHKTTVSRSIVACPATARTRWADAEPVPDDGQGVRRQRLQPLMEYWAGGYDWRAVEAKLNAL
ncbi:MAG: epoxide hydrolase N-terminal domain-containing protein, partial [Hyphomicrobium sp.]